jgi:hypothetical protein
MRSPRPVTAALAVTMTRETEQLLATANHYLAEAMGVLAGNPNLATSAIGEITRRHKRGTLSPSEVVLAQFGFAAVRLAAVCEIAGYQPRRTTGASSTKRPASRSPAGLARKSRLTSRQTHTSTFICCCATMLHMKSRGSRTTRTSPLTGSRYSRRRPSILAARRSTPLPGDSRVYGERLT